VAHLSVGATFLASFERSGFFEASHQKSLSPTVTKVLRPHGQS
jgi:hypothetical protein